MPETTDASPKQGTQPKQEYDHIYDEIAKYTSAAISALKDTSLSSVFGSNGPELPNVKIDMNAGGMLGNTQGQMSEEFRPAEMRKPGIQDYKEGIPPIDRIPGRERIEGARVTDVSLAANQLMSEKELGKDAFDKIQSLLKDKGPQAAKDYVEQINKALKEGNSSLELQMKDEHFPGRGPLWRREERPAVDTTTLKLVDKSEKGDKAKEPSETPSWLLKKTETPWGPIDGESGKPEYPGYEKFESPSQKHERKVEEQATELSKKLKETKDLKSIEEQLKKTDNFEDVIKKLNEKLKPDGSITAERVKDPEDDRNRLVGVNRFGNEYKVTLRMDGKPDQSINIDKGFYVFPRYEYRHYGR